MIGEDAYQCDSSGCTLEGVVYDLCPEHAPESWLVDALEEGLIDEDDLPTDVDLERIERKRDRRRRSRNAENDDGQTTLEAHANREPEDTEIADAMLEEALGESASGSQNKEDSE